MVCIKKLTLWFSYIIIAIVLFHTSARADDQSLDIGSLHLNTLCAPEIETNRRALIMHEEMNGMWFQMPVAMCMLERLNLLPVLSKRIMLLEHRNTSADELILIQQQSIDIAVSTQKAAEESLNAAIRGKREAERKLNHWTNSPWLWAGVGGVISFAITLTAIWAIDAAAGD